MKRALRILVPLALIVAVIGSAAWYLLVYDRDFTRDMLLTQARRSESAGHHQVAAWLYDLAYEHAQQDEDVAIELARQYEKAGNYTKAEYTLYNAISDGGSAKLYTERSRIFVAQDKLKDAVTMLDDLVAHNEAIGPELAQARPAAPIADYPEDTYTDFISIALSAPGGTIYYTTDGSYPSTQDKPYSGKITLPEGETVITALTLGDNGLVSSLVRYTYRVGGIIRPIEFADPAMEQAIRSELIVGDRNTVYTNELWEVERFSVPKEATNYADLAYLPYLTSLTIVDGRPDQLYHLGTMTTLQEIILMDTDVNEQTLSVIAGLPELTRLTMINCSLTSITSLSEARNLEFLDLRENLLGKLTPLANCQNLQEVYLGDNHAITDLSPLSQLSQLRVLDVSGNALAVIDPICGIPSLERLDVSNNKIVSLGNIGDLALLNYLNCENNALTSIAGVEMCSQLQELNIADNQITDILALSSLPRLGYLYFANNLITQLPAFSEKTPLVVIDGSHNQLTSLEELAGLPQLNKVLMDYNEGIESVEPLKTCHRLIQINLFGTSVTEVDFLKEQGVVVHYDPTLAQAE